VALFGLLKKKPAEELVSPPQPLPERNALCWCGSGQKYKKCHLEQDKSTLAKIRAKELAQKPRRSAFT